MRRVFILIVVAVLAILLLLIGARFVLGGAGGRRSGPSSTELDCCQCTALGKDQHYPFPKVPGETCEEHCFQGCLERGYSEFVCTLGGVGGYALACPEVLWPTVTPFGE